MKRKVRPKVSLAEKHMQAITREPRRKFSAEEKFRIVLEGLGGEEGVAENCRREGIASSTYYAMLAGV